MNLFFQLLTLMASIHVSAEIKAMPDFHQKPSFTIHYRRCDNNYNSWGLHLWRDPNIGLTFWRKPFLPAEIDSFGAVFVISKAPFKNSNHINFIIHAGEKKEHHGEDLHWDRSIGDAIWIVEGDSRLYNSKKDALLAEKCLRKF